MKRVLAVAACLLLTVSACSKKSEEPKPAPTTAIPTTASPTPSATPTPTEETPDPDAPPIDYDDESGTGAVVPTPGDTSNLDQTSPEFQAFISAELTRLQNESGGDCTNQPQIRVNKVQSAGWASGGVFTPECGGYAVLWAKQGGEWSQVWGGQELVDCSTLLRYKFPVSVAGDQCLTQEGASSTYAG